MALEELQMLKRGRQNRFEITPCYSKLAEEPVKGRRLLPREAPIFYVFHCFFSAHQAGSYEFAISQHFGDQCRELPPADIVNDRRRLAVLMLPVRRIGVPVKLSPDGFEYRVVFPVNVVRQLYLAGASKDAERARQLLSFLGKRSVFDDTLKETGITLDEKLTRHMLFCPAASSLQCDRNAECLLQFRCCNVNAAHANRTEETCGEEEVSVESRKKMPVQLEEYVIY